MDALSFRLRLLKEGLSAKEIHKDYIIVGLPLSGKSVKVFFSDSGSHYYLESCSDPLSEEQLIRELKGFEKIPSPSPSIPEPPPKPSGVVVPDALVRHLSYHHTNISTYLIPLILQRSAFGIIKYGQPLMSEDGRDGVEEARQEAGDLLQYAFKVYLSGDKDGLEKIRRLVNGVQAVVEELSLSSPLEGLE